MGRRRERRPSNVLDVVGAAVAALLAFTAVPSVLVLVVGNPLSGGLGHTWHPVPRDVLCILVLAAWVAWVACCAQLVPRVGEHVRRGDVGALRNASIVDRFAARIAVGVLALTSVGAPWPCPLAPVQPRRSRTNLPRGGHRSASDAGPGLATTIAVRSDLRGAIR